MIGVEDDHLGRAAGLAARLDDAGEGVVAAHEADRAAGDAAAGHLLALELRMGLRLPPAPEPNLKSMASVLARSMMRRHGVLDRVDEAGRALRLAFDAHVEPDRAVERHLLVDEEVGELRLERVEVLGRGEVALGLGPGRDRVDDAVDELLDAGLALRRADVAAEVLADDDVGGELAPEVRDLDVLLLEDGLAALVADVRGAVSQVISS